jgi:pimeloyl-ACP methyl ester carboxylesterase
VPHAHGVDLAHWERGSGPEVLFVHETATGADVWRPLAEALGEGVRSISYDRRGWGRSELPPAYERTTVEEQSEDAAALLEALGAERALLCGAGLGAVAALDLLLRRPPLVRAAVLIEPPLLAFVPEATAGLSADRATIEEALRDGGPEAALDLYLDGGLPFLGPGAERIPADASSAARERPLSLFAELGAVPAWPLRPAELGAVSAPTRIVVSASTPEPLRAAAAELSTRLRGSEIAELGGNGLPHLTATSELAALIGGLPAEDRRTATRVSD